MSASVLQTVVGVVLGLLLCWSLLVFALWRLRPAELTIGDAVRLLPDLLKLVARLARDRSLPRRMRISLWLLLGYLALPFDVVPDFIPVIGYADDAIVIALVLRTVVRASGADALRRHWSGSDNGLAAVMRICALTRPTR
jgi:uncharacterized membrane protein YkvA (DUF1232 family)